MTDDSTGQPDMPREKRRRVRIKPEERYREFVQKAVELFSEVGFDAGTRELAQRLNVTQPLLYRYFPSKEDLISAVYKEIYLDRWKPEWEVMLKDESVPILARYQTFYEDYTDTIFTNEWLRIYLFAGLRGVDINRRYIINVEERILRPMARSVRRDLGIDDTVPIDPQEVELFWTLHGGIFYHGVRKHVYGLPCAVDKSQMIANGLKAFIEGVPSVIRAWLERQPEADLSVTVPSTRHRPSGSRH